MEGLLCVSLQQVYLQRGQQPDAVNLVAALAALPPAVRSSATSAITFGLIVSGFILRLLWSALEAFRRHRQNTACSRDEGQEIRRFLTLKST